MVSTQAYREAKGSKHKAPKTSHHEVKQASNNGFTVDKHYSNEGMEYKRPETSVFSSGPEMIKHLMDEHKITAKAMIAHLHGDNEEKPGGDGGSAEGKAV